MKRFIGFNSKKIFAFALSAALWVTPISVSAADKQNDDIMNILQDNNIPTVYLSIDESAEGYGTIQEMNESPDHTVKCTGTMRIDVPEGYTGDYSDIVLEDTDELQLDYIRGRGNITWIADKKPYKIKLDKKAGLLGMGKNKHWALLANRYDSSMIRNRLVSYIGERLGFEYTPKMLPVDLVINGEYAGSYYLSETVRIGDSRVNIDELSADDNTEPDITGGYLLALSSGYYRNQELEQNRTVISENVNFWFEDPEFFSPDASDELGTPEQRAYIEDYLRKTDEAVYGRDFKAADGTPYTELMDIKSAADFWWVQEFLLNEDAFCSTSNYLYKVRDGKLYWGPLWDFDYTMGLLYPSTEGFNQAYMPWLTYLREYDPEYRQMLRERWEVLDGILNDILKDGGILDRYVKEQEKSAEDDEILWGSCPQAHRDRYSFEKETELVRTWLTERQAWVNSNIDEKLNHAYVTITFKSDGKVMESYKQPSGVSIRQKPDPVIDENGNAQNWIEETTKEEIPWKPVYEDMVFIPENEVIPYEESSQDVEESEVSETSETSEESEESEVSGISEVTDVSQASDEPADSEVSEELQVSEESAFQEKSEASYSGSDPESTLSSEQSAVVSPADNAPGTGDNAVLPVVMCVIVSLSVIAVSHKKETGDNKQ